MVPAHRLGASLARVLCLCVFSLLSTQARAAEPIAFSSTFDMPLPPLSVAHSSGPASLGINPAGLAFSPALDLLFVHEQALPNLADHPNQGADGLFVKFSDIGFGLQWVRPHPDESRWDYLKYSLAVPMVLGNHWLALGLGVEILDPLQVNENASLDLMLGALIQPWRYLSIGVVGRNLIGAEILGQKADRALDVGLAARPLWFAPERLTLAVDTRLRNLDSPPVRFTSEIAIMNGISAYASADLDGRTQFGLTLDLQKIGLGSFVGLGQDSAQVDRLLVSARLSSENHPGFILSHKQTAEYRIGRDLAVDETEAAELFHRRPTLLELQRSLLLAGDDPRIDSILIKVDDVDLSWATAQELRDTLTRVKQRGKKIFFHLQAADNTTTYLAALGDAIYLTPATIVDVSGPKMEVNFLGKTLELLGARAEYQRVGKYKSAVEKLASDGSSEPNREMLNSLVDEMADQMFDALAEGRKIPRPEIEKLVDRGILLPEEAKKARLVDEIVHFDDLEPILEKTLGHALQRRADYAAERWVHPRWGKRATIAVVHATGTITSGTGMFEDTMDANQIAGILNDLREADDVDAVVLRVDSPGGSGSASELIWQEMAKLRKVKPVIVSMGNLAASGGYYISAPADAIVANPLTLTGSIGVFSLQFDLSKLYEKIGLHHEVFKRGKLADVWGLHRGRTPEEKEILEKVTQGFYREFLGRVSAGRKMAEDKVDAVGQGRVWTGRQAKGLGLVDELGGLPTAIAKAKQKLGLAAEQEIRIVHLPSASWFPLNLMRLAGVSAREDFPIPLEWKESYVDLLRLYHLAQEPSLALMPFRLSLK